MSGKLIIAEDHILIRQGMVELLHKHSDYEVAAETDSGQRLISLVRRHTPFLAIIDMDLPDIEGSNLTRILKSEFPDVQVLVTSMHTDQQSVQSVFSSGASGYLLLTAEFDDLLSAIRTIRKGRRYLSAELMDYLIGELTANSTIHFSPLLDKVTERELEVLRLLALGNSTKDIASLLEISSKTIDTHRQQLMRKLKCKNVVELTRLAIRERAVKA